MDRRVTTCDCKGQQLPPHNKVEPNLPCLDAVPYWRMELILLIVVSVYFTRDCYSV